jgi:micrococcal nuclease
MKSDLADRRAKRLITFKLPLLSLIVWVSLSVLLASCQAAPMAQSFSATVQQVNNGRDLEVAGMAAYPEITERVRLAGVDVPDLRQEPWGLLAKQWLEQQLQGQTVVLESDSESHDNEGQRLAYVWQNGTLLNEKLVEAGLAIAQPSPTNQKYDIRLAHAQAKARLLGIGIWNPQQPMRQPPSEFRGKK